MIAAVLDVTPQDLGILESCWPTAAMAPHQPWLSQGMVELEEDFRQFLGSSWSDETRVAYLECNCNTSSDWLMCCGIWNVWSLGEKDTRCLLQKYIETNQLLKLLIGTDCDQPQLRCSMETGSSQWRLFLHIFTGLFLLQDVYCPFSAYKKQTR